MASSAWIRSRARCKRCVVRETSCATHGSHWKGGSVLVSSCTITWLSSAFGGGGAPSDGFSETAACTSENSSHRVIKRESAWLAWRMPRCRLCP